MRREKEAAAKRGAPRRGGGEWEAWASGAGGGGDRGEEVEDWVDGVRWRGHGEAWLGCGGGRSEEKTGFVERL